jgi:hypothetical protein
MIQKGGENLCHKSSQEPNARTRMYNNECRISHTDLVATTSAICGVKIRKAMQVAQTCPLSVDLLFVLVQ